MADSASLASIYHAARLRGALVDLGGRAQWRLTGADRVRYLNGQVTNDIRKARGDAAMEACVTSAKGKLCGVIFVSAPEGFLRIDAEEELRDALTGRLEKYIIADDVTLEDTTGQECLLHVIAADAPVCAGAEVRAATRFGRAGFDVIAPREEYERVLARLAEDFVLVPAELAETLRIEAGAPRWGAELSEDTLPPEALLDRAAIDYHKGCYIGQEVISRIKSVGHVNRMLVGFVAHAALVAGSTVHAEAAEVGRITSAGWSFGLDTWAGLGYLKRGFAETALQARAPDGATVSIEMRELPLVK